MLPRDLLTVTREGERLRPQWLGAADECWVEALCDRLDALAGRTRIEVKEALASLRPDGVPARQVAAVRHFLVKRRGFEVPSGPAPREVRALVFPLASRAGPGEREQVIAEAARRLGLPRERVVPRLHADQRARRVLRDRPEEASVRELVELYHLELVRSLLSRAESVRLRLAADQARAVLRFARLQGLMVELVSSVGGSTEVELRLTGPLSLLARTVRYGRALAAWFGCLPRLGGWRLEAPLLLPEGHGRLVLGHRDPIGTTHAPPQRFDSEVEERLFRDLLRLEHRWTVRREARPVRLDDARLVVPDFTLVDEAAGIVVPVEVVGFWTPEYLAEKRRLLAALPDGERWVFCVETGLLAALEGELPADRVLGFRRRVPARELLALVEAVAAEAGGAAS